MCVCVLAWELRHILPSDIHVRLFSSVLNGGSQFTDFLMSIVLNSWSSSRNWLHTRCPAADRIPCTDHGGTRHRWDSLTYLFHEQQGTAWHNFYNFIFLNFLTMLLRWLGKKVFSWWSKDFGIATAYIFFRIFFRRGTWGHKLKLVLRHLVYPLSGSTGSRWRIWFELKVNYSADNHWRHLLCRRPLTSAVIDNRCQRGCKHLSELSSFVAVLTLFFAFLLWPLFFFHSLAFHLTSHPQPSAHSFLFFSLDGSCPLYRQSASSPRSERDLRYASWRSEVVTSHYGAR